MPLARHRSEAPSQNRVGVAGSCAARGPADRREQPGCRAIASRPSPAAPAGAVPAATMRGPFINSFVESGLKQTNLGKPAKNSLERGYISHEDGRRISGIGRRML
jgi:hypothetical protein